MESTQPTTDSLTEKISTGYVPPPPGQWNSIILTAYRYIFTEYNYWEYFASLSGSNYNDRPNVSFEGIDWKVTEGNTQLAEYNGYIGWLFIPKATKNKRLPRYNVETKIELCLYLNSEMNAWLPGKDFVEAGKIDKKYLLDRDGDGSFNFWINPIELPLEADESTFDLNVSPAQLDEYIRSSKK